MDLSEIEVLFGVIDDALQCLLHTVLFLRTRQAVTPLDVECERLKPLTFPRCDEVIRPVVCTLLLLLPPEYSCVLTCRAAG